MEKIREITLASLRPATFIRDQVAAIAETVGSGPRPDPASSFLATATMAPESRPPLSIDPTGPAPRSRPRTASVKTARNASA